MEKITKYFFKGSQVLGSQVLGSEVLGSEVQRRRWPEKRPVKSKKKR